MILRFSTHQWFDRAEGIVDPQYRQPSKFTCSPFHNSGAILSLRKTVSRVKLFHYLGTVLYRAFEETSATAQPTQCAG